MTTLFTHQCLGRVQQLAGQIGWTTGTAYVKTGQLLDNVHPYPVEQMAAIAVRGYTT